MNKKLTIIFFFYSVVIGLSIIIPLIFITTNQFPIILDLIKTVSILATSIFAIIYFDPFGIKKKNIEKQYDNVISILEKLVGLRIVFQVSTVENHFLEKKTEYFFIIKDELTRFMNSENLRLNEIQHLGLLFDENNFNKYHSEILKLGYNLWTPREISETIKSIGGSYSLEKKQNQIGVARVGFGETDLKKEEMNYNAIIRIKSVKDLILAYNDIISSCERWLHHNSFSKKALNL